MRGLLAEDGVVVFPAPGGLTYLSPAMCDLHNALHATLAEVFPHVRPIPGDVTLWLASPSPAVESGEVEELAQRWEEQGLPTELMTAFHVRLKLDDRWPRWFWDSLGQGRPVVVNRDLHPSGLLYGLAYWGELFSLVSSLISICLGGWASAGWWHLSSLWPWAGWPSCGCVAGGGAGRFRPLSRPPDSAG